MIVETMRLRWAAPFAALAMGLLLVACGGGGGSTTPGGSPNNGTGDTTEPPPPPSPVGPGVTVNSTVPSPLFTNLLPVRHDVLPVTNLLMFTVELQGLVMTPDGSKLYSLDTLHYTVSVIDTASRRAVRVVRLPGRPVDVAMAAGKLYVVTRSADAVSVIDLGLDEVIAEIPLPVVPFGIVVTPDGAKAYVFQQSRGRLTVIDVATSTVQQATVQVGSDTRAAAITPDGSKAYFANQGSGTVTVVDVATDTAVGEIPVGNSPSALAVRNDGTRLYVANRDDNTVSVVDPATDRPVGNPITVGQGPTCLLLDPGEERLYVANLFNPGDGSGNGGSEEFGCDNDFAGKPGFGNTVSVVDLAAGRRTNPDVTVGVAPAYLAVTGDGAKLYAISACEGVASVVDTTTLAVTTVTLSGRSTGVALAPDNGEIYAAQGNSVSVIDLATQDITQIPARGDGPTSLAITATSDGDTRLYATRTAADAVVVVDPSGGDPVRPIDVQPRPTVVALSLDGSVAYVGSAGSSSTEISMIEGATPSRTIGVEKGPVDVAVTTDGTRVYAVGFGDLSGDEFGFGSAMSVIDTGTDPLQSVFVEVGNGFDAAPISLVTLDDGRVAVANYRNGDVWVVDPDGHQPATKIMLPVGSRPVDIALRTDDQRAFVLQTSSDSNTPDRVTVIKSIGDPNVATPVSVDVGKQPTDVAFTPLGTPDRALVTNFESNTVTVIDAATPKEIATLPVGRGPTAVAVAPDGLRAYVVSFFDDTLSIIDLPQDPKQKPVLGPTVPVDGGPMDVAVDPATGDIYVANMLDNSITVVRGATSRRISLTP